MYNFNLLSRRVNLHIDLLGIRIFTLCGLEVKSDFYTNQRLISPPITYQAGGGGGGGDGVEGVLGEGNWSMRVFVYTSNVFAVSFFIFTI